MLDIKKKLIAIALICAMSLSMSACTDKGSKSGIKTETLSSEEAEQLKRVEFSIEDFTEAAANAQDPVEGVELNLDNYQGEDNNSSADNNNQGGGNNNTVGNGGEAGGNNSADGNQSGGNGNAGDNQSGGNSNGNGNNNSNGNQSGGGNNNSSGGNSQSGGNNNSSGGNQSGNGNNNSGGSQSGGNSDNNDGSVIKGTETKKQSFWMDLSGDFVFDGEFITATFKIKDTTPDGTYPILVKWLDFSNIKAVSLDATGIDGSVVVGGTAAETKFKNDGSFEVKADSVSGKPGDTVTVSFRFNNNPGICASVFRFAYDSDALEYVSGEQGADFLNALATQNG